MRLSFHVSRGSLARPPAQSSSRVLRGYPRECLAEGPMAPVSRKEMCTRRPSPEGGPLSHASVALVASPPRRSYSPLEITQMSHARAQTLLRSLRASLPASSPVGGPTGFTPAFSAVRATPARAVPPSRRPLSTNSSPRAPYRRFGDPPRSAPSPHQHQPDSAPSARPVQPADARQVFELLRAATSRGGRGGGRSGFSAGGGGPGGGRPGWHNFQAYLRAFLFSSPR